MPTLVETTPFILGPCLGKMTKYTPCLQGGKGGGDYHESQAYFRSNH